MPRSACAELSFLKKCLIADAGDESGGKKERHAEDDEDTEYAPDDTHCFLCSLVKKYAHTG